jgi:DamX protein
MFKSESGNDEQNRSYKELIGQFRSASNSSAQRDATYLSASQHQLLEKLEHLSRYSHFILVVTGVAGVGKSTLLKQFYPNEQDMSVHACCLEAKGEVGASDLLSDLVEQLDLDVSLTSSDEARLQAIFDHADLLRDIGRHFLIVVDDAERLTVDALDLLLNLIAQNPDPNASPHLLLFASPKLKEKINLPRFSAVVGNQCHFIELSPHDREEMRGYIRHRFGSAADSLTEQQIQQVHNESFGLPSRVNKVLDKVLNSKDADLTRGKDPTRKLALPLRTIGLGVGVFFIVGISIFLLLNLLGGLERSSERLTLNLQVPSIKSTEPVSGAKPKLVVTTLEQKLANAQLALNATVGGTEPSAKEFTEPPAAMAIEQAAEQPTPQQLVVAPVNELPVPAVETGAVKVLVMQLPAPPSASDHNVSATVKSANALTATSARTNATSRTLGEAELLSWKPTGYTLQMLGARKEQSAIQFIESQAQPGQFQYFATHYKGKPWFVVVYGQYSNREQAVSSITRLPAELRKHNPWARSVRGVRNDINQR